MGAAPALIHLQPPPPPPPPPPYPSKMPMDPLIEKVQDFFFTNEEFQLDMERWAMDNCDEIDIESEENKLVYTEMYNKFQASFEEKMGAFIESQGSTTEGFAEK